jgi:hypothetical protein
MWHCTVNTHCFYTSAFSTSCSVLSAMDCKIEQHVCQVLCEAHLIRYQNPSNASWGFWKTFFKLNSGFWMAFTFQGRSSVSWRWQMFRATKHQQNDRKCWQNSRTHPWRPLPGNPWARRHHWDQLQSLPGDLNRKFEHALHCSFIMTTCPPTRPRRPQNLWLTTTWLSFPILPTHRT